MTRPLSGQSSSSRMRSLSLSGSGQPSLSSKPSLSSGSFGHRSSTSRMPSLSLSGSGQPSSSSKSSKSSGSSGHLSTSSLMPSPSRSPMLGSKMKPLNARTSGDPVWSGMMPVPAPNWKYDFDAR